MRKIAILAFLLVGFVMADSTVVESYSIRYIQFGQLNALGEVYSLDKLETRLKSLERQNIEIDSIRILYMIETHWNENDSLLIYLLDIQNMNPVSDTLGVEWWDIDTWKAYLEDERPRYLLAE